VTGGRRGVTVSARGSSSRRLPRHVAFNLTLTFGTRAAARIVGCMLFAPVVMLGLTAPLKPMRQRW